MKNDIKFISCVRNWDLYRRCVSENPNAKGEKIAFDNSVENITIPRRYNSFLNGYDYAVPAWFVFCHEDFAFNEDVEELLSGIDTGRLYGPIGSRRIGFWGIGTQCSCGQTGEDTTHSLPGKLGWIVSLFRKHPRVDTFDCCCLIVHSSLVARHGLRFDEHLSWDMYVEDFCAWAMVKAGIVSVVLPMKCHHYFRSGPKEVERLRTELPYLDAKYPDRCFSGVLTYFGHRPFLMRLQDRLLRTVFVLSLVLTGT